MLYSLCRKTDSRDVCTVYTPNFAGASGKSKERAKAEEAGDGGNAGQEGSDNDSDEGLEAAAEQDGLQSEVLRGKNMDVASMDALRKRIEVRWDAHIRRVPLKTSSFSAWSVETSSGRGFFCENVTADQNLCLACRYVFNPFFGMPWRRPRPALCSIRQ